MILKIFVLYVIMNLMINFIDEVFDYGIHNKSKNKKSY